MFTRRNYKESNKRLKTKRIIENAMVQLLMDQPFWSNFVVSRKKPELVAQLLHHYKDSTWYDWTSTKVSYFIPWVFSKNMLITKEMLFRSIWIFRVWATWLHSIWKWDKRKSKNLWEISFTLCLAPDLQKRLQITTHSNRIRIQQYLSNKWPYLVFARLGLLMEKKKVRKKWQTSCEMLGDNLKKRTPLVPYLTPPVGTRTYDIMINSHALLPTELCEDKIVRTDSNPCWSRKVSGVLTPWTNGPSICSRYNQYINFFTNQSLFRFFSRIFFGVRELSSG